VSSDIAVSRERKLYTSTDARGTALAFVEVSAATVGDVVALLISHVDDILRRKQLHP
jgi:hypothetical protein